MATLLGQSPMLIVHQYGWKNRLYLCLVPDKVNPCRPNHRYCHVCKSRSWNYFLPDQSTVFTILVSQHSVKCVIHHSWGSPAQANKPAHLNSHAQCLCHQNMPIKNVTHKSNMFIHDWRQWLIPMRYSDMTISTLTAVLPGVSTAFGEKPPNTMSLILKENTTFSHAIVPVGQRKSTR